MPASMVYMAEVVWPGEFDITFVNSSIKAFKSCRSSSGYGITNQVFYLTHIEASLNSFLVIVFLQFLFRNTP